MAVLNMSSQSYWILVLPISRHKWICPAISRATLAGTRVT